MLKRIILISLAVFGVVFFGFVGTSFADASLDLQLAKTYWEEGDYAQAEAKFKAISQELPGTDFDLAARKNLILMHILTETTQTQEAIDKLAGDFAAHSDTAQTLYEIADAYETPNWFDKARAVYQQLIQDYPNSPQAQRADFDIHKLAVRELIKSGDFPAANTAIEKLVADYPGDASLGEALHQFAIALQWSEQYDQARTIYEQISINCPDSPSAGRAKLDIATANVLSLIKAEQTQDAQASIEKLISDFSQHPDLPEVLYFIATRYTYTWVPSYEDAKNLYARIASSYPTSKQARQAALNAAGMNVLSHMDLGDFTAAEAALNKLLIDFGNHPDLPLALFWIGHKYYMDADAPDYEAKATASFEKIWNDMPELAKTPEVCCRIGDMYVEKGEWDKAAICYQRVIDSYPEYPAIWHALRMFGYCYENLAETGAVSESQAEPKIRAVYEQIIAEYPDSPVAKLASDWLSH